VQLITQTAENVSATGLDQRVPSTRSDREFTELIAVINGMLERLEKSYSQAVRFSADAAHELNTPLTVLQGELEQGIVQAVDNSEDQRRCNALLEEVQADGARMIISNASAELLDLDSGKLFERFYRGDPSRTRSDKAVGSGLGLSLSREIARAHGGTLEVLAIADDQVTFCLTLPALRQAA
jgi:signal transduction histidine kinase